MVTKYVENNTPNNMFVGGRIIQPGEGRIVDVPAPAAVAALVEEPDPDAALHELLAGNVHGVAAALDGLSEDSLVRLRELEAANIKPRKGVLEAIDAAAIALAAKALDLPSDPL